MDEQERQALARRVKADLPELYAMAMAVREVFGKGAKLVWVRFEDGTEWGRRYDADGTAVEATGSQPVIGRGK